MTIYQEILTWSQNKPGFIRDSLRRLISQANISQDDILEIYSLLKKENRAEDTSLDPVYFDSTHIPSISTEESNYPKLKSIKAPINICALHSEGELEFSTNGLSVIYGGNGSGKSSYSRILKKVCWSRNPGIELKKNVFSPSASDQQVDFIINNNGSNTNFRWRENLTPHPDLNSIYVFDTDCGEIYVNKENPTEYKPIGIDLLERLIGLLNNVSQQISDEVNSYTTQKPALDNELHSTNNGKWYLSLEEKSEESVESINLTQKEISRKQELSTLLRTQNPQESLRNLSRQKSRIDVTKQQFIGIEVHFTEGNLELLQSLRNRYESTRRAYDLAKKELDEVNPLKGFGTDPWRVLWDAARNFAESNGMTNGQNFPSDASLENCVLCQQVLDQNARERLTGFSNFILNDVSTQLRIIQGEIREKIAFYNSLTVTSFENLTEIDQLIDDFQRKYIEFNSSFNSSKIAIVDFLENGGELNLSFNIISNTIDDISQRLDVQINQTKTLLENRASIISEHNELSVKKFLFDKHTVILQYYREFKYKAWLQSCQSQLSTGPISRKIGDLMENQAVDLQHQEFINHLSYFNSDLASKVLLSKTRTHQGSTFQKCSLDGLSDSLNSVLSEGEQKIIALSNFLAESTIDGKKNSLILDDPVTSLDMDYRDLIANKIVQLSQGRQVIVFTHDLSFMRLLLDTHKSVINTDCHIIGIDKYNGISGIVTDEIPYLAKNVQERIDSIKRILSEHDGLALHDAHGRETKLDSARKRFRMLLERSVEELLSNKTYERFSKNIHLKKGNLSSYIITEQSDVDFLINLYSKYSVTEHDGGTTTLSQIPDKAEINSDINEYSTWKNGFKDKLNVFKRRYV